MRHVSTTDQEPDELDELDELVAICWRSNPACCRRGRTADDHRAVVTSLRDLAAYRKACRPLLRVETSDDREPAIEGTAVEGLVICGRTTVAVIADDSTIVLDAILAVLAGHDLVPADLVPADLVPADLVPADLVPADLVPGGFWPDAFGPDALGQCELVCFALWVRRGADGEYLSCSANPDSHHQPSGGAPGDCSCGGTSQSDTGQSDTGQGDSGQVDWVRERWIQVSLRQVVDPVVLGELRVRLLQVLEMLAAAARDQSAMRRRIGEVAESMAAAVPGASAGSAVAGSAVAGSAAGGSAACPAETAALLRWLLHGNFTLLATAEYHIELGRPIGDSIAAGQRFGLLVKDGLAVSELASSLLASSLLASNPQVSFDQQGSMPRLTVSAVRLPVPLGHRGWLDELIVLLAEGDRPAGVLRILGLFGPAVDLVPVLDMPVVRQRVLQLRMSCLSASDIDQEPPFDLDGYLHGYPRQELLACPTGELISSTQRMVSDLRRARIGLSLRVDPLGRFVATTVCLSTARLSPERRLRLFEVLRRHFRGTEVELVALVPLGRTGLVRMHCLIWAGPGPASADSAGAVGRSLATEVDIEVVIAEIDSVTSVWDEAFRWALRSRLGDHQARRMYLRYHNALTEVYQRQCDPAEAVDDVLRMEQLEDPRHPALRLFRCGPGGAELRFRVYRYAEPTAMVDIVAAMHSLGIRVFDVRCYEIPRRDEEIHIADVGVQLPSSALAIELIRSHVENAVEAIVEGLTDSDQLNSLVVLAGLTWRQVRLLRTIVASTGQPSAVAVSTLLANPEVAALLVELLELRQVDRWWPGGAVAWDDAGPRDQKTAVAEVIRRRVSAVSGAEAGRVLRSLLTAIGQ